MDPDVERAAALAGLTLVQYLLQENQRLRQAAAAETQQLRSQLTERERSIASLRAARDDALRQVWRVSRDGQSRPDEGFEEKKSDMADMQVDTGNGEDSGGDNGADGETAVYDAADDAIGREEQAEAEFGNEADDDDDSEFDGGQDTEGVNAGANVDVNRLLVDAAKDPVRRRRVIVRRIIKALIHTGLVSICRFNVLDVTRKLYDRYHTTTGALRQGVPGTTTTCQVFAGGHTQSRKTPLKLVHVLLTYVLGFPHILITSTVRGRNDLHKKFNDMVAQVSQLWGWGGLCVKLIAGNGRGIAARQALLNCIASNGCIVLSDTKAQVQKARLLLLDHMLQREEAAVVQQQSHGGGSDDSSVVANGRPGLGYAVTLDEADGMIRTAESTTQVEAELDLLFDSETPPLVKLSVLATLLPVLLAAKGREHVTAEDIIITTPGSTYAGIDNMAPLQDKHGFDVFLQPGELTVKTKFTSPSMDIMMSDAMGRPRSLHIVMVNSRQYTTESNMDLANRSAKKYPHAVVMVLLGKGIRYKLPGQAWVMVTEQERIANAARRLSKLPLLPQQTIGEVLEQIDQTHLEAPLVVYCYRQYMRLYSIRSSRRVGTHLTLSVTNALSISIVVQAFGRVCGEQLEVLRRNGFVTTDGTPRVTVLTHAHDYDSVSAHPHLMAELVAHLQDGAKLKEALCAAYSACANIRYAQPKTIGPKKAAPLVDANFEVSFEPVTKRPRGAQAIVRAAGAVAGHSQFDPEGAGADAAAAGAAAALSAPVYPVLTDTYELANGLGDVLRAMIQFKASGAHMTVLNDFVGDVRGCLQPDPKVSETVEYRKWLKIQNSALSDSFTIFDLLAYFADQLIGPFCRPGQFVDEFSIVWDAEEQAVFSVPQMIINFNNAHTSASGGGGSSSTGGGGTSAGGGSSSSGSSDSSGYFEEYLVFMSLQNAPQPERFEHVRAHMVNWRKLSAAVRERALTGLQLAARRDLRLFSDASDVLELIAQHFEGGREARTWADVEVAELAVAINEFLAGVNDDDSPEVPCKGDLWCSNAWAAETSPFRVLPLMVEVRGGVRGGGGASRYSMNQEYRSLAVSMVRGSFGANQ